jgi:hypothetical protein
MSRSNPGSLLVKRYTLTVPRLTIQRVPFTRFSVSVFRFPVTRLYDLRFSLYDFRLFRHFLTK